MLIQGAWDVFSMEIRSFKFVCIFSPDEVSYGVNTPGDYILTFPRTDSFFSELTQSMYEIA